MSNIDGVNNLSSQHLRHDEQMGRSHDGRKRADAKEAAESPVVQTNKLIIEMHIKIKIKTKDGFGNQAGIKKFNEGKGIDLSQLQYNGRPITELSQDEAKALISEDGFFSVKNTAQRIFDFVSASAGDDPERLKVARDAVLKGFGEAEELFGGTLPDISYDTLDKLLEMIDEKMRGMGGSVVDIEA